MYYSFWCTAVWVALYFLLLRSQRFTPSVVMEFEARDNTTRVKRGGMKAKLPHIAIALVTVIAVVAGAGLTVAQPPDIAQGADKVTLCDNLPPTGEFVLLDGTIPAPIPAYTEIEVTENAKGAYSDHGDVVGECDGFAFGADGSEIVGLEERTGY